MKKYLLVTTAYPSENNKYANGFIHTRVKEYAKSNKNILVWVNSDLDEINHYEYEGIEVRVGKLTVNFISENNFSKILCHFIDRKMISIFNEVSNIPIIIWFHGVECLKWHRRLFEFQKDKIAFIKYILANEIQLVLLRIFLKKNKNRITCVFVSEWMKEIAERDIRYNFTNYNIIPNPINNDLFEFTEKNITERKEVLVIRPFSSNKYATDLIIETIIYLNNKGYTDINYQIYGSGHLWDNQIEKIVKYDNVICNKTFLSHEEIANKHKQAGVFLCPTRQDAQGVSMCEAMASGLVVISTDCTAIPEYIEDKKTGLLVSPESSQQLANALINLYNNPELFQKLSRNGHEFIVGKCGINNIIKKEIILLEEEIS